MLDRKQLKERAKQVFKANYWKTVAAALITVCVIGSGVVSVSSSANNATQTSDGEISQIIQNMSKEELIVLSSVIFGAITIAITVDFIFKTLLLNPLEVGCRKFFIENDKEPATFKELTFGFKNYGKSVGTQLLRSVLIFLWSLLLIVPGIMKTYSYKLVPYILAEEPELSAKEILAKSEAMMKGHRWEAFVLDLSFIGWDFLSALTFGLVGIFYAAPYEVQTNAEFYLALKGDNNAVEAY